MVITVTERVSLVFGGIIPEKGNILEMSTAKVIKEKVDFSSKEKEEVGMKVNSKGMLTISKDKGGDEKEFSFSAEELSVLNNNIMKLDRENNISMGDVSICVKIQAAAKKENK